MRTAKPKPDELVQCIVPFAAALPGDEHFVAKRGARLRAGHAAVKTNPQYFAPADATDEEIGAAVNAIWPAAVSYRPKSVSYRLRATRTVSVEIDGRHQEVKKGEIVTADHPVVGLAPDAFERVVVTDGPDGVSVEPVIDAPLEQLIGKRVTSPSGPYIPDFPTLAEELHEREVDLARVLREPPDPDDE